MGTGHTVAKLADASELPGVTVAQVNYSTVTDGEVTTFFLPKRNVHVILIDLQSILIDLQSIKGLTYCVVAM